MKLCPCSTSKKYQECCGRFIEGKALPSTPEELMRSRYTAYTQANIDYIADTMKPPANNNFDKQAAKKWARQAEWKKLEVLSSSMSGDKGWVEFIAYYFMNKQLHTTHEASEFKLENGKWYYIDGIIKDR